MPSKWDQYAAPASKWDQYAQGDPVPPTSGPIGTKVPEPDMTPSVGQNAAYEAVEGAKGFGKQIASDANSMSSVSPLEAFSRDKGPFLNINTQSENPDQTMGKALAMGAEGALPLGKLAEALPSATRASSVLGDVAKAAKDVHVPLSKSADALQRVTELGARGGTAPKAASDLLARSQAIEPMTFPEARDYYSNISSLSGDEAGKLNGVMKRAVGGLRAGFHGDLTDAAGTVGMGDEYANAIKEYANAMKLRGYGTAALTKVLPASGVLGAVGYGIDKLRGH